MSLDLLNKFSTPLKQVLGRAVRIALQQKQTEISPINIFYSLLQQKGCLASNLLHKNKVTPQDLFLNYQNNSPDSPPPNQLPEFSLASQKILTQAAALAQEWKHHYLSTEHLLKALLDAHDPKIEQLLKEKKVNLEELEKQLTRLLKNTSQLPQLTSYFKEELDEETADQNSALSFFGTNLTDPHQQQDIDPVIGRGPEIERLIHILARRTKNNPVLIGEPGVGKTAIVEGLAKRILEKKVPPVLLDKQIYKLDLSLIVAGTMYRGEFESRFKQIIEELQKNKNIIVFIDEIHTLIGTGGSGGPQSATMDAANILKPALAKGEIRCLGATTADEYRKHIESDPALERRFQSILVEEPTPEESLDILKGIKTNYELYHQVTITDQALETAVNLSVRYLQDRQLPDKAIDLIDEAAAGAKVNLPLNPLINHLKKLEEKLHLLETKKESLIKAKKFDLASELKTREENLKQQIKNAKIEGQKNTLPYPATITEKDVAKIISKMTGLPLGELVDTEKKQVLNLEKNLNEIILGQTEATKEISNFIKRSRAGLSSPDRPLGSFVFLGPSGVGKTELAKVLARQLFGDEKSLLRLDMSEFKEGFNVSKLIGAPAGYVGYKEGAKLTDFVKRKPYSVILFDEIEKANPDVFNLLLQILEDGQLTDATGKKVNFKNTLIIMTSNLGLKNFLAQAEIGFNETQAVKDIDYDKIKNHVLKELKDHFRPEFLNRLDKIIVFKPLTLPLVADIAKLQVDELQQRLNEKNINLKITKPILKWLAEESFSPEQGARALRHTIQEKIETPLAEEILKEKIKPGQSVQVEIKNNHLIFN